MGSSLGSKSIGDKKTCDKKKNVINSSPSIQIVKWMNGDQLSHVIINKNLLFKHTPSRSIIFRTLSPCSPTQADVGQEDGGLKSYTKNKILPCQKGPNQQQM